MLGRRVGGQPAQINFENDLAVQLLRRHHQLPPGEPLLLEDEGHFIGGCTLPDSLWTGMTSSPLLVVEVDLESRVEHSFKNYILDNLRDWQKVYEPDEAFSHFAEDLRQSLARVRRRLGGVRYAAISGVMEQAIDAHHRGDESLHREWIRPLLRDYYDPMYDYQLQKKADRVRLRGNADDIRHWLNKSRAG